MSLSRLGSSRFTSRAGFSNIPSKQRLNDCAPPPLIAPSAPSGPFCQFGLTAAGVGRRVGAEAAERHGELLGSLPLPTSLAWSRGIAGPSPSQPPRPPYLLCLPSPSPTERRSHLLGPDGGGKYLQFLAASAASRRQDQRWSSERPAAAIAAMAASGIVREINQAGKISGSEECSWPLELELLSVNNETISIENFEFSPKLNIQSRRCHFLRFELPIGLSFNSPCKNLH
jgi:hypothetical protein